MNYPRIALAALGGMVAQFACGFLITALFPGLIEEGHKYAALFRPKEQMMAVMPVGMAAIFVSLLVAAVLFALIHRNAAGAKAGAHFGALMGVFVVCAVSLHNYMTLNIGLNLTLGYAAAYFVQWVVIGTVIGLIYQPRSSTR